MVILEIEKLYRPDKLWAVKRPYNLETSYVMTKVSFLRLNHYFLKASSEVMGLELEAYFIVDSKTSLYSYPTLKRRTYGKLVSILLLKTTRFWSSRNNARL